MRRTNFLLMVLLMFMMVGCERKSQTAKEEQIKTTGEIMADTTPRVTGIGGIFFFSEDPSATKAWYSKNLGLVSDDYGAVFESRNANRPDEVNYLIWTPFKDKSNYFAPSVKPFMINYRVQNLRGLVRQLKAGGVNVLDSIETYDYGKFVHIMDPEGNKIELWEPVDSVLTKMGGKTTK